MPIDPLSILSSLATAGVSGMIQKISDAPSFDERIEERRKAIEAEKELREKYGLNRPNPYEPVGYAPDSALRRDMSAFMPSDAVVQMQPVSLNSGQLAAASMFQEQPNRFDPKV